MLRVAFAVGVILLASLAPALHAPARPHSRATAQRPESLHEQVEGLFDRLDEVSRSIEGVRADIASTRGRIAELLRQIEVQQRILNEHAAEAYMSPPAVTLDGLLGAGSIGDLQDALEFVDAVSRRDQEVLLSLERRKAEEEMQRARLEGLEAGLRRHRERLEATVADLVERLERQRVLLQQAAEDDPSVASSPTSPPLPAPSPPGPAPGREAMRELIREQFASLGARTRNVALCVAEVESNLDPLARNPVTGASGLFQFIPSTWASLSELAGWSGASVFEGRANAAVAAWTVAQYGWHPWRSVAADCRA